MRVGKRCAPSCVALLLLGTAAAACRQDAPRVEEVGGVQDDAYVQVMAELMFLDAGPPPGVPAGDWEASLDSLREGILTAHGVTASEILEFAATLGSEAGRMEALWQVIAQKYDSMRVERLRQDTEARSEPEGKLGREAARPAPADSVTPAVRGTPPDQKPLRRRPRDRPALRDTAIGSK